MPEPQAYDSAFEEIDRIVARGGDADDALRDAVGVLRDIAGFDWAGIAFVEGERLQLGPAAGTTTGAVECVPVTYEGRRVAELQVEPRVGDDAHGQAFLERVATLVSAHCLVGWDTGGDPWQP